jgi:hypothetical protein
MKTIVALLLVTIGAIAAWAARDSRLRIVSGASAHSGSDSLTLREFHQVQIDTVLRLNALTRGNARRMRTRDSTIVVQSGDRQLIAFDQSGKVLWTFANADTTMVITDFGLAADGSLLIFDVVTQSLHRSDFPFETSQPIPLTRVGRVSNVMSIDDRRVMGLSPDSVRAVSEFDYEGNVHSRVAFPDEEFAKLPPMLRQGMLLSAGGSKSWIFAYSFRSRVLKTPRNSNGFSSSLVQRNPAVRIDTTRNRGSVGQRLTFDALASRGVGASSSAIALLPGSRSDSTLNRIIDFYSMSDGGYLGSVRLPRPIIDVAATSAAAHVVTKDAVIRVTPNF